MGGPSQRVSQQIAGNLIKTKIRKDLQPFWDMIILRQTYFHNGVEKKQVTLQSEQY